MKAWKLVLFLLPQFPEKANNFNISVSFDKFTLKGWKTPTSSGFKIFVSVGSSKIWNPSSLAKKSILYDKSVEFVPWESSQSMRRSFGCICFVFRTSIFLNHFSNSFYLYNHLKILHKDSPWTHFESNDQMQWHNQRVLDTGIPVWAPKLSAQIIEKCLKQCFHIQTSEVRVFVANI